MEYKMAGKKFDPHAKCEKAVIFARVSTQHQQDEGSSIDAQLESIRNYCKENGLESIKEYILAESSTRGDRKQYHEMLNFVQNYIHHLIKYLHLLIFSPMNFL